MTLDPRDYDPGELQDVLGEDSPLGAANGGGDGEFEWAVTSPRESLASNKHRELAMLQSMGSDVGGKPYVEALPSDYGAETVIFEWLDYLLSKAGFKPTLEALRYYESMEWISAAARDDLEEYLLGLDAPEGTADLDVEDHSLSLVYVARLAAMGD